MLGSNTSGHAQALSCYLSIIHFFIKIHTFSMLLWNTAALLFSTLPVPCFCDETIEMDSGMSRLIGSSDWPVGVQLGPQTICGPSRTLA
jgi:hypothetical protein